MVMNAIDLTDDLRTRTGLGEKEAKGIVRTIMQVVEDGTDQLVTRDHLDAEMQKLRAEMHQFFRSQTTWLAATMLAVGGFIIAAVKLIP